MDNVTLISIIKAIIAVVLGIYIGESSWLEKKVRSSFMRYVIGIAVSLLIAAIFILHL